ncbi:uncharacterized protein TNCV_2772381 [Trichonephila clavipes]|nr:uncharacterized protein TNCV_2772381 [Trichonephila clavipes]
MPGEGCGSPVVKVSYLGRHVMSSSPESLKYRHVRERRTLNLSRSQKSSLWCGVEVRRGGCQLRCCPRHLTMVQNYGVSRQSPRVAEQCDVNIHPLTHDSESSVVPVLNPAIRHCRSRDHDQRNSITIAT